MDTIAHGTSTINNSRNLLSKKCLFFFMVMDVDSRNLKSDPRPLGSPENPTGGHRTIRFRNFKVESEK